LANSSATAVAGLALAFGLFVAVLATPDAAVRADKDGWTYVQLLQYYYAGVEVEKIY